MINFAGVNLGFNFAGFQLIYVLVACFMWICSLLFSIEYMKHYEHKARYFIFMVATWLATAGVLASSNLLTTFICFELMSFTSYVLVIHEETPGPLRAGETYLAVAVIGGMVMLMGLFLLYNVAGTLTISELTPEILSKNPGRIWAAGICILFGFGAKAGMFPLHIWLPKAHPIAPAPASALLSGILTKSGIFGAIVISVNIFFENISWGVMMASIGMITMLLGAVLGVFSIDLKRTLACSSVSQIGFITLGIGMTVLLGEENALASSGTFLHMLNHSMIKLLLFSCAGVVYMNLHKLNLNDIKGFGRGKILLTIFFLIGAASISGIPGTSGYISKTLLHESIVEYIEHAEHLGLHKLVTLFSIYEWVFLFTGGLTLCYMTKLFVCIFIERNNDKALQEKYRAIKPMNGLSSLCLAASAIVLFVLGITPHESMDRLAEIAKPFLKGAANGHLVHYFSLVNLKGSAISITIGLLVYLLIVRTLFIRNGKYKNLWPQILDLEELLYRPLIRLLLSPGIFGVLDKLPDAFFAIFVKVIAFIFRVIEKISDAFFAIFVKVIAFIFRIIEKISDAIVNLVLEKFIPQYYPNTKRFSISKWYNEGKTSKPLVALHEAYLEARDSMSFGLFLAFAGLTVFIIYAFVIH